jgi:hypothetical protein
MAHDKEEEPMGELVQLVVDNPDPEEVRRRERLAWKATERAQDVDEETCRLEDESAEARKVYARTFSMTPSEEKARRLTERRERLWAVDEELVARRRVWRRLDAKAQAAWGYLFELFGGDYRRFQRWEDRDEAKRLGLTVEECDALTHEERHAIYARGVDARAVAQRMVRRRSGARI